MSQPFTQTTQPRRGGGTEKFVDGVINFRHKFPNSLDEAPETSKKAVATNLRILKADKKWDALSLLLVDQCSRDRGERLFEFTHSILSLLPILPDPIEVEELTLKTIKFLLRVLRETEIDVPNFFGLYNDLMVQLKKITSTSLIELVKFTSNELTKDKELCENSEGVDRENETVKSKKSKKTFNQRWKDFVSLVIKRIQEFEEIEYHDDLISGSDAASNIIFDWLKSTEDVHAFELVTEMSVSLGCTTSFNRFCDEEIAEKIGVDSSADDIEEERRRRARMTWKALILTTKVEKERLERLWNGVICSWEISEDDEKEMRESRKVSEHLEHCFIIGHRVLNSNVESSKKFLSFIKNEKFKVLRSGLGLALALVQCGSERNDTTKEMKRSLEKLWTIGEHAEECAWMSEIVCGRLLQCVDIQFRVLTENLHSNENLRLLLSRPIFALMLSLLDTTDQKEVVIVDGRVADGSALWLLSRDVLVTVSQAQTDMGVQLSGLLHAIASASSSSSALILIDVLRELVKKCSVEILNNSKLLDGLFDYVCRMRRDIAVSLIRCLIPIINTRPQLRNSLFKSLKKDLLGESTVCSAVPIVLLLLRSVSKRREEGGGGGQFDHSMSQSFGTFCTQTLNNMGCTKNVDQSVGLELIGILKSCLWQPATTKISLYDGICEIATQTTTMLNQFLDMMLSHAKTTPEWRRGEMTSSSGNIVQLVEPVPHLIQTVECLISELSSFDPEFKLEGTETLLRQAANQMETWVSSAMRQDVQDMGLDRNSEWTTSTVNGRASLLFAQMMLSVYDVLIEHMWRRVEASETKEDADKLVVLLTRRNELDRLFKEKTTVKRDKDESNEEDKTPLDSSQSEILTSSKTLSSIMKKLMEKTEEGENNTTINVRVEDVQLDLLSWAIGRTKSLSSALVKNYRPLHSILSGTNSLMSLSKSLLDFYVGNTCPNWVGEIPVGSIMKTLAIESYGNILQFFVTKFKQSPSRVTMSWFEEKDGEDEETRRKRQDPNILVLRHAHFLSCRLFRQVLDVENDDVEEERRPKAQYEMQGRAILRAASSVLRLAKNVKVWSNLFTRISKVLESETFCNNQMLRDYCKFVTSCALRCADSDKETSKKMNAITENILEFLSEETEEIQYRFISKTSLNVVIEFQFDFVEKSLAVIRDAFGFMKEFCVKPPVFDEIMCSLLAKCSEVTDLVSRCLQFFVQYKLMQEKVTELMTSYFSTIRLAVLLFQNLCKGWGREMSEWSSTEQLATLIKTKLRPILSLVDDNIGFSKGKEEMKKKISQKTRYAKSKKEEKLFSRFSQERESVQHGILVLCKLIKDDRFDLQIRNNSAGYRDFRIDMDVLLSKLSGEVNDELGEPVHKRRRGEREEEDEEDDEAEEDITGMNGSITNPRPSEEPMQEDEEEPRDYEDTEDVVKNEVEDDDENEDDSRGPSPVF